MDRLPLPACGVFGASAAALVLAARRGAWGTGGRCAEGCLPRGFDARPQEHVCDLHRRPRLCRGRAHLGRFSRRYRPRRDRSRNPYFRRQAERHDRRPRGRHPSHLSRLARPGGAEAPSDARTSAGRGATAFPALLHALFQTRTLPTPYERPPFPRARRVAMAPR